MKRIDKESRDKQKADPVIVKYRNLSVIVLVKQLTINIIDHAFVFDSDAY